MKEEKGKKIKIAHVVLNLDIGGLETLVVDMVQGMDQERFEPVVICLRKKGELAQRVEELGFKVYSLGNRDKVEIKAFFQLAKLFIKEKVSVVHCHNTAGYFYGGIAAILSGFRKIIYTEHGRVFPDASRRMLIERILSWFTYRIVAVSEDMKRCLIDYENINPKKIQVILNGIDADKFKKIEDGKWRAGKRRELGIGNQDIVVGNVARFDPVKGHDVLIQAFALIKEKIENRQWKIDKPLKLMLVGNGTELENSKQLCRDMDLDFFDFREGCPDSAVWLPLSIFFLRTRKDIAELMNVMDIFVLPSRNEGISLTLLEAMACGVPVVATDVGGNPDVIKKMGKGVLVEPDNPEALSRALERLISSALESSSELGSQGASALADFPFSFDEMIKKYEALYG